MSNALDLSAHWMPFSANRRFKADPRLLERAQGVHYYTADDRPVLDATSGLWCVNAGHGQPPIVQAIQRQAERMAFAPAFNLGHSQAFELATRLGEILPGDLDRVFFANSGSEAVDTALKIALAYQQARGQGARTRLIGRERAYHGVGFGGLSVGGMALNRRQFGPLLTGVDYLRHTHDPVLNAFSRGQPEHGAELADDLERLVTLHGAETIAAVIVEPVAGSAGVLPPPKGYLERLRALCDRHDILLIFDEVITGFGRTGSAFAAQTFDVTPDILTMAKGLTNATVPMGAVAVRRNIHDTVVETSGTPIELFHGYTYSGHPLASAAALATLDVYRDQDLFARAAALAPAFEATVHALASAPGVVDVRNLGMMAAIELAPRADAPGARATDVFHRAFDQGLLIRVTGDIIALSPPLVFETGHLEQMGETLRRVIEETA